MPALNAEKTIAGAINSILTQTYENWELIIVDDGSTDKTKEVVERFQDERIRYFQRPHAGIPASRNFGSSKARGDYIVIQDSDDYSLPRRLEIIKRYIDAHNPDVIIAGMYINAWNNQYQCLERRYVPPKIGVENCLSNRINGVATYKKELWLKRPMREETKYSYDWMMHLDWTLSGAKYAALDEGLYEYVRYAGSASDRFEKDGKRAEAFERIHEIVEKEYGKSTRYSSDGVIQATPSARRSDSRTS